MTHNTIQTRVGADGPLIRIELAEPQAQEQDVSALTEALRFDDLTNSVSEIASAMTDALRRARPDEAEVTFGIDATIETGKLTSILIKGSGTATFSVRLLWKSDEKNLDLNDRSSE